MGKRVFRKHFGADPDERQTERDMWYPHEIAKLLSVLDLNNPSDRRAYRWVIIALNVPARVEALLQCNWQDDIVRDFAGHEGYCAVEIKSTVENKRADTIRCSDVLIAHLDDWDTPHPIELTQANLKDQARNISKRLKLAAQRAGIEKHITARTFRYVCETLLEDSRDPVVPEIQYKRMLGHDRAMTSKYNLKSRHAFREAIDAIDNFWREVDAALQQTNGCKYRIKGLKKVGEVLPLNVGRTEKALNNNALVRPAHSL